MPHWIVLVNFTDQGVRNIRDFPKLMEANNKLLESMGIRIRRYFTMGQYDMVVVLDAPGEEEALTSLLTVGAAGNIRTTTLRAFTESEFLATVQKVPASGAPAVRRRGRPRK